MCFVFGAKLTILGAVAQVKIYYCLRLKFLVFDLKKNFLKYISKALLFNGLVTLLDTLQEQFSLLMVAGKSKDDKSLAARLFYLLSAKIPLKKNNWTNKRKENKVFGNISVTLWLLS